MEAIIAAVEFAVKEHIAREQHFVALREEQVQYLRRITNCIELRFNLVEGEFSPKGRGHPNKAAKEQIITHTMLSQLKS